MARRLASLALLAPLAAAACGDGDVSAAHAGPVVAATTTQVADLARNVAGRRASVTGLLAPNADPHAYEPRPRDVRALAKAGLVLRSGGELDDWLADAIDSAGGDAPVVSLIDSVRPPGGDPHWWQDPSHAQRAVRAIRDALAKVDPGGRAAYAANARAYLARLGRLDRAVRRCVAAIPPARRRLVTTHDALGPYARRYGLEVIGTVIPSRSTAGQTSAGQTARLVRTIRRAGVPVIFTESSVNPGVERAIAREAGARVGRALWADTLGARGSDGATYVASIAANTRALAEGLGGDAGACSLPA
ncbi:MAG TPA: zinc ABC transporter substrate-binding protein [Solirubrobacteraceae bacterium]|nr:zinc ABC transporter substrate-binding protein [Solirubrobacteraceae bacterium]